MITLVHRAFGYRTRRASSVIPRHAIAVAALVACAHRTPIAVTPAAPLPSRWCSSLDRLDSITPSDARARITAAIRRAELGEPVVTDSAGVVRWVTPVVTRRITTATARFQVVADLRADVLGLKYYHEVRRGPVATAWAGADSVEATADAMRLCTVVGRLAP